MMPHPLTFEMTGTQVECAFNAQGRAGVVRCMKKSLAQCLPPSLPVDVELLWSIYLTPLETQFHHVENGDNNTDLTRRLQELSRIIYIKPLAQKRPL